MSLNVPITQSEAWHRLQDDLRAASVFTSNGDQYQYLAIVKPSGLGTYLYLPYGPVVSSVQAFQDVVLDLAGRAREFGATHLRIEPTNPEVASLLQSLASGKRELPVVKSVVKVKDLSPKETWILDLPSVSEADPLENRELKAILPSRLIRYYKSRAAHGLTITTSHDPRDIHFLLDLQKSLARKKGINTFSEKYLQTELKQPFATLYLAHYQEPDAVEPIVVAAGLVFDHGGTRYNLQGAQSDLGRRLHATGILTIELILDAVKKHLTTFDFWGIASEGAPESHPWAGFTAFKKTFAGREVDYAGTYDLVLKPSRYRLYQLLRTLRRKLR